MGIDSLLFINAEVSSSSDSIMIADKAPKNNNIRFYKVKRGETLQIIARNCNTTIEALCKLNNIQKNIRLKPGQIIKFN